jgi:hypothetical protein
MATEKELGKEEEDNASSSPLEASNTPLAQSNGAPTGAPQPSGTTSATPSGRPNIKQYLQANQGAGDRLSEGIQHRYGDEAAKFNKNLGDAKTDLDSKANPLQQTLEQGEEKIKTAFKDPQSILNNQQEMQNFQKLRDKGYQGEIQGLGDQFNAQKAGLQGQLQGLGNAAQMANTESGRFQLLQQAYGQPNYTRGQQKLDQLFLQTQPNSSRNLSQGMSGQHQAANQAYSGYDAETQARMQALQGMGDARANQIQSLIKGGTNGAARDTNSYDMGIDDITTSAQERYDQALNQAPQYAGIQDRLVDPSKMTADDIRNIGLEAMPGDYLYDVKLADYYNGTSATPTLMNTANRDEVARYRALQQLSGDTSGDIFGGQDLQEAGSWKPVGFDPMAANTAISSAKQKWEADKLNQTKDSIRNRLAQPGAYTNFGGTPAYLAEVKAFNDRLLNSNTADDLYKNLESWLQTREQVEGGDGVMSSDDFEFGQNWYAPEVMPYWNELTQARGNKIGGWEAQEDADGDGRWDELPGTKPGWTPPKGMK